MATTKITFTAPISLKETLLELKDTYHLKSVSAVIEEAVKNYKKQKELEKWEKANAALLENPILIEESLALSEEGDNRYYDN